MELKNDVEFNSDMFLELIVNFQKCEFVDPKDLNFYKDGEGLDTISVKNLETRLEKKLWYQCIPYMHSRFQALASLAPRTAAH